MVGLSTLERLRTLHERELYAVGDERARRRIETNAALLVAFEDGIRTGELAHALGISVALTNNRLERARVHANSQPLDPDMVPLAELAEAVGVPMWQARRLRRAGSIPSARWRLGQWWVQPAEAGNLLT